jgi:TonB family protein
LKRDLHHPKPQRLGRWIILSVLLNLWFWVSIDRIVQHNTWERDHSKPVELVFLQPQKPLLPPIEEDSNQGQIVDLPDPETAERPEDADYLAEADRKVEEETRTEEYKLNPEILAPEYAEESKMELEDVQDVGADSPSTGAKVGNDRFDPQEDGLLAALPSPFQLTNLDGLQRPTVSAHKAERIAGAPNNDLLDEETGIAVNLNTKEFLYANYINQIRRLVVFYWRQQLDNLPRSLRISKPQYKTVVFIALNEDGLLDKIQILESSGLGPLDNAVVEAFKIAGPYPEPPEGLLDPDGRARLSDMGFTVEVGQANSAYKGIDPRAGVQFPGILKSPR